MLADSRQFMTHAPWWTIAPGLAIMFTVLNLNFVGDALRDALDPTKETKWRLPDEPRSKRRDGENRDGARSVEPTTAVTRHQRPLGDLSVPGGPVEAVTDVSLSIEPGETVGLVGESGSGKSVTAATILGLLEESARIDGSVEFDDQQLLTKTDDELREIRGDRISMIFQETGSSLNPSLRSATRSPRRSGPIGRSRTRDQPTRDVRTRQSASVEVPPDELRAVLGADRRVVRASGYSRPEQRALEYPTSTRAA